VYNYIGEFMLDLYLIEILEKQINTLYIKKIEMQKNKPFFFERKKFKIYQNETKKIDQLLNEYNQKIIEEYIKLERK